MLSFGLLSSYRLLKFVLCWLDPKPLPFDGMWVPPETRFPTDTGEIGARQLLKVYWPHLYERNGNYEEVSRRTKLDRRAVKNTWMKIDAP